MDENDWGKKDAIALLVADEVVDELDSDIQEWLARGSFVNLMRPKLSRERRFPQRRPRR